MLGMTKRSRQLICHPEAKPKNLIIIQQQKTAPGSPVAVFLLICPTESVVILLAAAFIPTAAAAHEYVEQKDVFAVATLLQPQS